MTFPMQTDDAFLSVEEQYIEQAVYGALLRPRNQPAQEFLSRTDGSLHPALDARGFTIERGRLIISPQDLEDFSQGGCQELDLQELYRECFDAHNSFLKTYYKIFKASSDEEIDAAVELSPPSKTKSFQEVEAVIAKVCEHLEAKQRAKMESRERKTSAKHLHNALAQFRRQSKNIEMFLGVLPSGSEYVSLICGALSVVFSAIDKHETLKENVWKAIDEIRIAMGNQEYAAQVYREDPQIHKLMASVCASIFDILGYILRFVGQTSLRRVIMPLLRPATYGDELPSLLSQLQTRNENLVNRAQLLLHGSTRKAHEASSKMTTLQLQEMIKMSYSLEKLHSLFVNRFEDHEGKCLQVQGDAYNIMAKSRKTEAKAFDIPGALKMLMNDQRRKQIEPAPVSFDIDKLLDDMEYKNSLIVNDCSNISRGYHLTRQEEIVISLLTSHIRLEAFIKVKRSAALLILGGDSCRDTPRSAISYFNANMIESLTRITMQERSICVLAYFCGEHTDDGEPFSSPLDLITTFVLQLLSQVGHSIDPEVLLQSRIMDTFYEQKVESVCKLLTRLLDALPQSTIAFCLIDGVSFFESPKSRKEDMTIVVRLLLQHSRKRQRKARGAKLKVLFAAPSGCDELHEMFEEYEIFAIHDGLRDRDALR